MTLYQSIYKKLVQIGILNNNGKMPHMYMKFTCDGMMGLNCDRLTNSMIAIAHNGLLNGDVMADPDVQIVIYPGKKEAVGITFQNDYMGIYQDINATGKVNEKLKNEINIFLDDWLSNIINCEYKLAETED